MSSLHRFGRTQGALDMVVEAAEKIPQVRYIGWDIAFSKNGHYTGNLDKLVDMIVAEAKPTDQILVMSNGSFGGIHQKILDRLK